MKNYKKATLQKLMDLKIDVAFQKVFGFEDQKNVAISFFNEILDRTSRQRIQQITMQTKAIDERDDLAPLHFIGTLRDGKKLHILVNFLNRFDIVKYALFHAAKAFSKQSYNDLSPVIFINLLSYELLNQTESFQTTIHLQEQGDATLFDGFQLHFIEFPKLIRDFELQKIDPWNDGKYRWLLLLALVDQRNDMVYDSVYKELDLISLRDDALRTAIRRWQELSYSKDEYEVYTERLKQVLEEEVEVREAKHREEEAFQKGVKQQQQKIAKKMLAAHLDIQTISKITGLSIKEIQTLNEG